MSPPTQRSGLPPEPAPEISHRQATDPGQSTAPWRLTPVAELPGVPFPYGRDYPDTDLWVDRDGRVHRGDGPYLNRPSRRLVRAIRQRWFR